MWHKKKGSNGISMSQTSSGQQTGRNMYNCVNWQLRSCHIDSDPIFQSASNVRDEDTCCDKFVFGIGKGYSFLEFAVEK